MTHNYTTLSSSLHQSHHTHFNSSSPSPCQASPSLPLSRVFFRDNAISAYNSTHPDPLTDFLWCPILCEWLVPRCAEAIQLFLSMHGQDAMDVIVAHIKPPELA
jgi:hypothetical protein